MTKFEFGQLFQRCIERSATVTEETFGRKIPRNYLFECHFREYAGAHIGFSEVLDNIYIDGEHFYVIIDVAIMGVRDDVSLVFVRPSGHQPTSFDKTWLPNDLGPFKILISKELIEKF